MPKKALKKSQKRRMHKKKYSELKKTNLRLAKSKYSIESILRNRKTWIIFIILAFIAPIFFNFVITYELNQTDKINPTYREYEEMFFYDLSLTALRLFWAPYGLEHLFNQFNLSDVQMKVLLYSMYILFWALFVYFLIKIKLLKRKHLYLLAIIIVFLVLLTLQGCLRYF